jgi:dihydrofolate reductase
LNTYEQEDQVGRIVVTEFISLDGVVEAPSGVFDFGDEGRAFKLDELHASHALLLGRVTYEIFAGSWPSETDEVVFAEKLNSMPKYVVSATLENPEWNNSTVLEGDVGEAVTKLKQESDGNVVVHGSAQLVQALVEHDLVDELRLMVFPIVLGSGKRLFGETSGLKRLRLADSRTFADGITVLIYEPAEA